MRDTATQVPADLLRRALKNHDAIAAGLRTGMGSNRLFKAIDDMRALKAEAAELGCYPGSKDILRRGDDGSGARRDGD